MKPQQPMCEQRISTKGIGAWLRRPGVYILTYGRDVVTVAERATRNADHIELGARVIRGLYR